jgi:hypothetical protein
MRVMEEPRYSGSKFVGGTSWKVQTILGIWVIIADPNDTESKQTGYLLLTELVSSAGLGERHRDGLLYEIDQNSGGSASDDGGHKACEDECAHRCFS